MAGPGCLWDDRFPNAPNKSPPCTISTMAVTNESCPPPCTISTMAVMWHEPEELEEAAAQHQPLLLRSSCWPWVFGLCPPKLPQLKFIFFASKDQKSSVLLLLLSLLLL